MSIPRDDFAPQPAPVEEEEFYEIETAETKAWDALGRYKFQMFGYWAGIWVHLNRIEGGKRPNPWKGLVQFSRAHRTLTKEEA